MNETNVYCAYDELVDVVSLVPNPRNPNKHPENQIELLAKIIKNQGWRLPITVSNRSGFIVRGHGRLEAAILLGLEKVPVDYQDYKNEAEEWADLIADNRLSELSFNDRSLLADIITEIKEAEELFDLDLTGYDNGYIESLLEENTFLDSLEDNPIQEHDKRVSDVFSVTFNFPIELMDELQEVIIENKDNITDQIIEIAKGLI